MGALTGRMSPLVFTVAGGVDDWDKVMDNLVRYRFQPLDPASGKQQSFGWVLLSDPFSTELEKPRIFFGEDLVGLSVRVDAITVPASQLKLHLGRRVKQAALESGKENLPKAEVARLKEDLLAELMSRSLPHIKLFEMVYHTVKNRVWFFGRSKGVVATFAELFNETFGLSLVLDSPFTVARALLGDKEAERLLDLGEAGFVSQAE